jgi:hypothetical protein
VRDDLDRIQKDIDFLGRSGAVKAGIRMLLSDLKEKETLIGAV